VLRKIGCPDKFVKIVESFHEGMQGQVTDGDELCDTFAVTSGTKQGRVLASLLFRHLYLPVLLYPRVTAVQCLTDVCYFDNT